MFKELEIVQLIHDINEHNLKQGDRGTVVEIYRDGEAYEIEFVASDGSTKALLTLMSSEIRSIEEYEAIFTKNTTRELESRFTSTGGTISANEEEGLEKRQAIIINTSTTGSLGVGFHYSIL